MKEVFVVVPTLNPNKKILNEFLEELKGCFEHILIVNDGCKREYKDYFKKLRNDKIIVLDHYVNMGKGRALKDAFNYILNKYPNIKGIVTADSDGQHSVKDIQKIAKKVLTNQDSLILGCRNFNLSVVPFRNKMGNKITRSLLNFFTGIKVSDTQTGLRGLSREVASKLLTVEGERFEFETYALIETKKQNIEIIEEKIDTIYLKDSNKESHFNPITDSLRIYKIFILYLVSALSSFIVDILLFALFINIFNSSNNILLGTIFARIISSFYNYFVNSNLVFKEKNNTTVFKYFMLCFVQMFVSGGLAQLFSNMFNTNVIILKIIIDTVIFMVNYFIQNRFIFIKRKI